VTVQVVLIARSR